ncbi:hem-containing dehydratase-domain containing protein [Xylariaceae sp. FL1651]|nr:hem-containing dehydratase-domain containing protein [Xylariaceae sp. FL1651]
MVYRKLFLITLTDPLDGKKAEWKAEENGTGPERRGWEDTYPRERELCLGEMYPVLVEGMDFLRDHGDEVGCYSCRLMDIVDPATGRTDRDRTFGLAYFDELPSLERWSREHLTHLAIFGGFLRYARKLQNNITLRLFHEVLVLKLEQQLLEYVGCHAATGMLTAVNGHPGCAKAA